MGASFLSIYDINSYYVMVLWARLELAHPMDTTPSR